MKIILFHSLTLPPLTLTSSLNIGIFEFKETVSVILSDPLCRDFYARFTTVPLKPLSDQQCGMYCCLLGLKVFNSVPSCSRNFVEKSQSKITSL